MGKAAMCIQMLQILNTGRIYKISELAEMLETNPRNVIEYKRELEECGYYINTIPGRYGGYQLDRSRILPSLRLNANEKKSINEAMHFIENSNEFAYKKDFLMAMAAICSSFNNNDISVSNPAFISRFPLAMSNDDLFYRYNIIDKAIRNKNCVEIDYLSNDNVYRKRVIEPYTLYMYNNSWFVIAWCEMVNKFLYFKLCRMRSIATLSRKYVVNKYYNEREYIDSYGMTKNGDWFDVKLKFTGKAAMCVKDYTYGQNQEVEECEDGSTILKLKMQYKDTIVKFVLNYADQCEALEPQWLIDDIKSMLDNITTIYKDK